MVNLRYFPPVYSQQPLGEIFAAAVRTGIAHPELAFRTAEEAIRQRYPQHAVVLTDSGTSALTMAITRALAQAAERGNRNYTVALPAYVCPDVATAALGAEAQISLYDVDPHTLNPDWEGVEATLRSGASVLVVAHLYGRVVDLRPALALANASGAVVVEDAAQHASGSVNGLRGGAQGSLGVLSFGRGKGINAGGGGALLVDQASDRELLPALSSRRGWSALAQTALAELLSHPSLYGIPMRIPALRLGETRFHSPMPLSPMPVAVARMLATAFNLEFSTLSARRLREAQYYEAFTAGTPDIAMLSPVAESGALRTPVRLSKRIVRALPQLARLGVVQSYPRTLMEYREISSALTGVTGNFPGAELLASELYTLPTHSRLADEAVDRICSLLKPSPI
jgi:perosamine synthetase